MKGGSEAELDPSFPTCHISLVRVASARSSASVDPRVCSEARAVADDVARASDSCSAWSVARLEKGRAKGGRGVGHEGLFVVENRVQTRDTDLVWELETLAFCAV